MRRDRDQQVPIGEWEQAEIERSAYEAAALDSQSLRIANLARYSEPLRSTPYPLEYCCHLLGDIRGKVALDLGCGAGENTAILAMRGARVTALDISPELVGLARRRLEVNNIPSANVEFVVGSAYETTLKDASVDVVFGIGILHHLDLGLAQQEVYRILRTGAFAIFQEPVRDSRLIRFGRRLIPYRAPDVSPYERPLTSQELRAFAAPFKVLEERMFGLPHLSLAGLLLPRLAPWAYRSDAAILRAAPLLRRYASIRVLKLAK